MKRLALIVFVVVQQQLALAQTNAITFPNGDSYHRYGPNTNWGAFLNVGGNNRQGSDASVMTTNGNLHLDAKDGYTIYLSRYNNGNIIMNHSGGSVGIGADPPYPGSGLHVYQDRYALFGPNSTWGAYLQIGGNGRQTTNASVVTTNGNLHLDAKDGNDIYLSRYNTGNVIMNLEGGSVGIGTADPKSKLSVNGQIRATEIKVMADIQTVPDYVFEPDYELRTLEETKAYITENKHLPEIPSAGEMAENGIDLGDMNMKLLKKIEELTLYQIELLERLEKVEGELTQLKNKPKR